MSSKLFRCNEHPVERVVRAVAGAGVLSLVFVGPESAWGYLGLVPLLTGIVGVCPVYSLFGISTCRRPEDEKPAESTT